MTSPSPWLDTHAQAAHAGERLERISDGARISALRELELLDSDPDETLDRFTRLATELLSVPISLVTLIDFDRQLFLSQRGLPDELAASRETPLSHSLCKYATAFAEPVVVSDARDDPLLCDNGAVRDLGVVAYAGMPLVLEDGLAVGALCAIDYAPRRWSERELQILEDLAAAVRTILEMRAALVHRSLHDRLTGLPNRDLLVATCEQFLSELQGGAKVAVVCAGIDHFNLVNQAFGTANADCVLQAVAERLAGGVRETDVFGRLRGDVFALIAADVPDEQEALEIAARVQRLLTEDPIELEGEPLSINVSIGIATGGRDAQAPDVVSEAANAMREAKRNQRRVWIAQENWTEAAAAQLKMREALHGALDRGEITVDFQPIVELEGERVVAFEALARWAHPELGTVSPEDFIPLAELTADILPMGEWVMDAAVALAAELRAGPLPEAKVSVNVSPAQLQSEAFAGSVERVLRKHGLGGNALAVEVTEGDLLETGIVQKQNLRRVKELGARIVLDDFGTGYSALGYLRDFAIDTIKIDRRFVEQLPADRHSAALVQAIVAMARAMDMQIVAEGIETAEQAQILRLLGCRYGQGYLFGRPAPAAGVADRWRTVPR